MAPSKVDELYQKYAGEIQYYLKKITKNSEAAYDLTQDVFVVVLSKSFQPSLESEKFWLLKIANNLYRNWARKAVRREAELVFPEPVFGNSDSYEIEWLDFREKIEKKLFKENPAYYQIFILKLDFELSYRQIAKTLGLSLNRVNLYMQELKKLIDKDFGKELRNKGGLK